MITKESVEKAFIVCQERAEVFLPTVADELVQLVIMDAPYDLHDEFRQIGTTTRMSNWFPTMPLEALEPVFKECYRVLQNGCHMYVFCDWRSSGELQRLVTTAGFTVGREWVWDKGMMGTGHTGRPVTERILFCRKGKRPRQLKDKTIRGTDLLKYFAVNHDDSYPSEKPVDLLEHLILQSTEEEEFVLDPFMGSGATGEAAIKLLRRFVGNDCEDKAVNCAMDRLNGVLAAYTDYFSKYGLD